MFNRAYRRAEVRSPAGAAMQRAADAARSSGARRRLGQPSRARPWVINIETSGWAWRDCSEKLPPPLTLRRSPRRSTEVLRLDLRARPTAPRARRARMSARMVPSDGVSHQRRQARACTLGMGWMRPSWVAGSTAGGSATSRIDESPCWIMVERRHTRPQDLDAGRPPREPGLPVRPGRQLRAELFDRNGAGCAAGLTRQHWPRRCDTLRAVGSDRSRVADVMQLVITWR